MLIQSCVVPSLDCLLLMIVLRTNVEGVLGQCVFSRLVGMTVYIITKHDHLEDNRPFGVRQNKCCLT